MNENGSLATQNEKPSKKNLKKPFYLIAAILLLMFLAWYFNLGEKIRGIKGFIDDLGVWGPLVYGLIYAGCVVAMIPGSGLTVIAGALFGSLWGTVVASLASITGAALCFLIARYFARDSVSEWVSGNEKFRKLDELTKTHGGWIVAVTRLVPLFPFNLLNYGFGLTRVSFWTYVFLSWLCMLPGTVMYVVGADAITKAVTRGEIPWHLIGILVLLIIALTFIVRFARKKLRQAEEETPSKDSTTEEHA